MKVETWDPAWIADHCQEVEMTNAWRGVETQYIAASLKLVDTLDEQELLEQMLEESKPPTPQIEESKHYLLLSPFRYFPQHSSRFRPAQQSGLWYGSSTLEGSCSEIAYWRMKFIKESAGLAAAGELVTEHTFYNATVRGKAINLMDKPWADFSHIWKHTSDYSGTHKLSEAAAKASIDWIQYESVRAPSCALAAVLTPNALHADANELEKSRQEWTCKATRDTVLMIRKGGSERFSWSE